MDWFNFCLDSFSIIAQSILHIGFVCRFSGKKEKTWYFFFYFFLLCLIEIVSRRLNFSGILAIILQILVLYGINCFAIGNQRVFSWTASLLAVYLLQISFGIINSIEGIIFPYIKVGNPLFFLFLIAALLAAFLLCLFCYTLILTRLSLKEEAQKPYIWILLLSGLFFLSAELYLLQTDYHHVFMQKETGKHFVLLVMQILGLGALFGTLYAYQHTCRNVQAQSALALLKQAAQNQKTYVAEAQARYEKTQAFRHDIKNHFSVLNGLLNTGQIEEAKCYLKKLETAASSLTFFCQTGNPVLDVLLGEKLELARLNKIESDISFFLPKTCAIDDFDLCVIFANALDNAINACQQISGRRFIAVKGEIQGDFYMLEFKNSCLPEPIPPMGTGLINIKAASEKYHGAMLTEKKEGYFFLNILLNISLHPVIHSSPKN